MSCILHQRLRTELLAVIVHEMVAISVAPQVKKIKNVHCQRLKLTPRGSQRYSRHHSDVLSTISGALAWRGRPGVGALAGGVSDTPRPPHHTGGLYFAWLRPKIFRALRARVFPYIRGLSNGVREVLIAKGAYNTAHIMSRWAHGTMTIVVNESFTLVAIIMPLSVLVNVPLVFM